MKIALFLVLCLLFMIMWNLDTMMKVFNDIEDKCVCLLILLLYMVCHCGINKQSRPRKLLKKFRPRTTKRIGPKIMANGSK
ncbi:hypothetical protein HanRHA438_Chr14g0660011 [Helianthus annuus]|nr:hypothetical protein HanRHA438_Chr14g0660011 [Helianthus annuus]